MQVPRAAEALFEGLELLLAHALPHVRADLRGSTRSVPVVACTACQPNLVTMDLSLEIDLL